MVLVVKGSNFLARALGGWGKGKIQFCSRQIFFAEMPRRGKKRRPGQPFAEFAKNALNKKVKGQSARLNQADLDGYNRPVVEIWLNDKNINLEMVEEGWAEAYKGKTKRISMVPYLNAEKEVQKKKRGIWKLKNYESPREFRKRGNGDG